ncbi:MAG: hypothetical protein B5766_11895 [Candidatus Lumbricidophila eiseniae]|uniref:ABC transporter domain-containing protein n=1 Tax=Candidatus Lumbricidiphila eiseniae TaxID=1969409 RepID=A0A2A6FNL0_9MICO|nr:MAG: hypothetical protein B5766_11895 [Candidatus Lumbricidophila eiseniae]
MNTTSSLKAKLHKKKVGNVCTRGNSHPHYCCSDRSRKLLLDRCSAGIPPQYRALDWSGLLRNPAPDYPAACGKERSMTTTRVSDSAVVSEGANSLRAVPILVNNLSKTIGRSEILHDLTFAVAPGRVTGFLGPNGAGKTMTLRILLGLVAPNSGTATFGRRSFNELTNPGNMVASSLDSSGFHPGMRVGSYLRIQATALGVSPSAAQEVIDATGVGGFVRARIGSLSLGMRQRLSLTSALIGSPSVLVLDEPMNGLDPHGVAWLRDYLRYRAALGHTVLVSSHALAEAENLIDDVVLIDGGRLVLSSSLTSWRSVAPETLVISTAKADELTTHLRDRGVIAESASGIVRSLGVSEQAVRDIATQTGIELVAVAPATASLEQLFLDATSRKGIEQERG